jgi:hypothetical protein
VTCGGRGSSNLKSDCLGKKSKGWSRSRYVEIKKSKADIISELDSMDRLSEQQNLTMTEIDRRKEVSFTRTNMEN